MSQLSKAQRDKLPADSFGDPERRLFPIVDQADVDSAKRLIGKAKDPEAVKKRIIAIAKRKNLTVPDAWRETVSNSACALGSVVSFDDEYVIRTGKLWEADYYEDKHFGMTPEELLDLVETFQPVPLVDTHLPSVFNPLMAGAETIGVSVDENDSAALLHVTKVPKWLDAVLPDDVPISAQFDPETKRLVHVALVPDPRVADAALKAGFAQFAKRHDTPTGQMAMQEMHDIAARHGAVCKAPVSMASRHEASAIQQMHDTAVDHGATCASGSKPSWFSKERAMGFKDTVKAWFNAGMPDDFDPSGQAPAPTSAAGAVAGAADPEKDALKARVAAFEKSEADRMEAEAAAFAQAEVTASRILPDKADEAKERYLQAARDDAKLGVVTFSNGTSTSRVAQLRADYAVRTPHQMTQERVSAGQGTQGAAQGAVLFNQQTTADPNAPKAPTPESIDALMAMTPLGRASKNGTQQHN